MPDTRVSKFGGSGIWDRVKEIRRALSGSDVKPATICAGYGGCPLDSDPAGRRQASDDIKQLLEAGGEIGVVGLIFVPIFGKARISDLSPWKTSVELEKELLVDLMSGWAEIAEDAETLLLLEPLNRYETHLVKKLCEAVELVERVDKPKA